MANTALMKTLVEPYVRLQLETEYGQPFSQQFLVLPSGGRHEFDAVSQDGNIVCSIKSNSGLTSGGKRPGARSCPATRSSTTCSRSKPLRDSSF